jgi:hypothetical protein
MGGCVRQTVAPTGLAFDPLSDRLEQLVARHFPVAESRPIRAAAPA